MTIVVLGGGIEKGNKIPTHVKNRLDEAYRLYLKDNTNHKVLLCGRYSFLYPKNKVPKKTESELNKEYLLKLGVKSRNIYMENQSKDTIGNVYYAKKLYFIPKAEKDLIVITSDFHIRRARFLFKKIFGKKYNVKFISTPSNLPKKIMEELSKRQGELIKKSKEVFDGMKDGDHDFLKNKLYKIKFYKEQRPNWVKQFVAKGKTK